MPIHVTTTTVQSLSNKTFVDRLSTTNVVFASSGNSDNWSSVYSTVQANSATTWNYQGTDIKSLTSNWENTYATVLANSADWSNHVDLSLLISTSANWDSNYTTVNYSSANWENTFTTVYSHSANWDSTYTNFSTQSANNISVYSTVDSYSANWDSIYTNFSTQSANNISVYTTVNYSSANWEDTFTTVYSHSATWEAGGAVIDTGVRSLTADYSSTFTTVNDNSAAWINDAYEEVWVGAGAMVSPTLSGAASTTIPITGGGNEIYVDAFNFDAAAIEYAQFSFLPPTNCNRNTFKCQFAWTTTVTGSAVWGLQATSLTDSNTIDVAWGNAQESVDYATGTTTFQITSATNTISPSGSTNNNSMLLFRAYRNANSGSDTLAVDASLLGVRLQYMMNGGLSASW